jgi:hypothetical protein
MTVEQSLYNAKQHFNKREYIQFILPILDAVNDEGKRVLNQKVRTLLRATIDSSMITLTEKAEEINTVPYVSLETVEEVLNQELFIYTT